VVEFFCPTQKLFEFPVERHFPNEKAFKAAQYPFRFQIFLRIRFFEIEVRFFGTPILKYKGYSLFELDVKDIYYSKGIFFFTIKKSSKSKTNKIKRYRRFYLILNRSRIYVLCFCTIRSYVTKENPILRIFTKILNAPLSY
jgi:hypothetical protein